MRLEFFMPMVPPTLTFQDKQSIVVKGRGLLVDTPELKAVKAKLRAHLAKHVPAEPFTGPVRVVSKWCWPCEGTDHVNGEYRISKPDADNLSKLLHDLMEKLGYFVNDSQVMPVPEKFWADVPGIYVCIEELS
jgi:Holliday junction resolvase RusA-like endonuclease